MCQYSLHIKCYSIQSFISALQLVSTQKAIFSLRLKMNVTRQFHTHALCMGLISCGNFVEARIVSGTQVFHRGSVPLE